MKWSKEVVDSYFFGAKVDASDWIERRKVAPLHSNLRCAFT